MTNDYRNLPSNTHPDPKDLQIGLRWLISAHLGAFFPQTLPGFGLEIGSTGGKKNKYYDYGQLYWSYHLVQL